MSDPLPVADPLTTGTLPLSRSETIELDTDQALHVPHQEPTTAPDQEEEAKATPATDAPTAAAASASAADEDDADDSEPLSEEVDDSEDIDSAAIAEHQARMEAFLHALQHPEEQSTAATAGPVSSGEEEVLSEAETAAAAANPDTAAAVAEIQAFLNRQQAEFEEKRAAAASTHADGQPQSPRAADAAAKAAARAAHKANFRAQMEERRRQAGAANQEEEEGEDDEEEDEFAAAAYGARPSAASARATAGAPEEEEEEEEEDEEEEEPVDESFLGWLKSYASDTYHGKQVHALKSRSKWLTGLTLSYAGKALYVLGTFAVVALPGIVAEMNEVSNSQRMARCSAADISNEVKAYIWSGAPVTGATEPTIDAMALTA